MTPTTQRHRGVLYEVTDREIGELSRHWIRSRAERAAERANARRALPTAEFRVVQRGLRYIVVAFQNLAVPE